MEINFPPFPACNSSLGSRAYFSANNGQESLLNLGHTSVAPSYLLCAEIPCPRLDSFPAPPKGMNLTLEHTEGHLCRAGESPGNRSLRRREIVIPFRFVSGKEDLDRARNGSRWGTAGREETGELGPRGSRHRSPSEA